MFQCNLADLVQRQCVFSTVHNIPNYGTSLQSINYESKYRPYEYLLNEYTDGKVTMNKSGSLYEKSIIYIFPALALLLSLYAKETSRAAKDALYLCLDVVIPSLFPFFVLSRLTVPFLKNFVCPRFLKRIFRRFFGLPYYFLPTIVLGYLSGYPTGAKLARDMFDEGMLDSVKASRVIAVANNCSPLFIIGTVGAGLFKSIRIGFILLAIHWIAGLVSAIFLNRILKKTRYNSDDGMIVFDGHKMDKKSKNSLTSLIPGAVEDAAILSVKVAGYIVLFAVLSELLGRLGVFSFLGGVLTYIIPAGLLGDGFPRFFSAALKGILEIASGSNAISLTINTPVITQLAAVSLICGFAGFSVHTQVMGIMKGTGARYRIFLLGKVLQGLTACILTVLAMSILPLSLTASSIQAGASGGPTYFRIFTIALLIVALMVNPYEKEKKVSHKIR